MHTMRARAGVTLVEIMIVVVVLGILGAVAIPRLAPRPADGHAERLAGALTELRNAIELYYFQHGNTYPGARSHASGDPVSTPSEASLSFVRQLTLFSDADGVTSTTRDTRYRFGPYLTRGVPANPYNDLDTVACDIATTSLRRVETDGTTGWTFHVRTGRLVANDGGHDVH